ncbi:ROK family transcriptional regulator [Stackebrandtia nassauensis]|uniref:ROK family protein n=1 Tax=Stackebrandtia nassauensis (strain DSM 44728 / CIP 108903 / NRRL B-16338 / NBRC 102104 / LLR-40K-21) TaxID=446470 RepID=D3PZG1_STANL|nr:ROK family transcriptional regulator [Stackebrandtia nassauensis]ADD41635.1 ROK family protein [Stackebrandtia nassauensis DSM 44728]
MSASHADAAGHGGSSRLLRLINERTALGCLFLRDRLTRPELVELTGFSKPTASEVIKRLRAAGLVTVAGRTSGGPGPRADVYAIDADAAYSAAVSLREPDRLDVAVADLRGELRRTVKCPLGDDPEAAVVAAVADACAMAEVDRDRLRSVWVAVPGSYDGRGDRVRNIDIEGLETPGLRQRLAEALGTPVRIDNDVNLAALAERHHGVGGTEGFALLWLGEAGIGLGIDLGDEAGGGLLHGFSGAAGEIGYLPIGTPSAVAPPDLQELAAGPAIVRLSQRHGREVSSARSAIEVAETADDAEFFDVVARRIAIGLASVVTILAPAVIVLAGEIGAAGSGRLGEAVGAALAKLGFGTPVKRTAVEGDAVLRGGLDAALATVRRQLLADPLATGNSEGAA